jgi:hypothetical protein
MGKKKKKLSKEEIEAERLAREEEERIAAELEAKRLEEERIAAEKAYKERQEELSKLRSEELIRLRSEQDDSVQGLSHFTRRLAEVEAESQANMEWERYVHCSRMPNPLSETELNTFVSEWLSDGILDLEETLSTCIETETVSSDITSFASTSRGRGDMDRAKILDHYANKLRDAQLKKIDYATSSLLTNASKYTNEKNECKISANVGTLKFGLWINVALKPFRLKVVDFGKTGIIVDIPKPLALHSVAVRVLYHPANHVSGGGGLSGDEVAVGGVLHMDLLEMPPSPRNVKGWVMRQVTHLSSDVGRISYPPGSSDSGASSNAPPLRVKCVVSPNVVVPSELKMGWWNEKSGLWVEDGVTDATFDEESRLLSFHTTQLQSIAMIQPRYLDLPISKWSIRPTGPSRAIFSVTGSRFQINIEVKGEHCTLQSPQKSEFSHLIGVPFVGPGTLFDALKKCGVNMCPTNEDANNCSLPSNPGVAIVTKNSTLESLVERDVCTLANAFCISGSSWNQMQGSESCVFRIQEAEIDETKEGDEVEESKESGEWKTILYAVDRKLNELEVDVTTPELLSSVKCVLVKGGEDEEKFNDTPEPSADTHAYLKYCLAGKCTPDALENMSTATPLFTQTVRSLLHLCRVFSFS